MQKCFDSDNSLSFKITDKDNCKFGLKIEKALYINLQKLTCTMEVVKRRRNNSEKQPCFSNYFFQRESRKKTSVIELVFQYYIRRFIQTNLLTH